MTREDYARLSMFRNIDVDAYQKEEEVPFVREDNKIMQVLNEIFSVDPVSGVPRGDLSYYLSPDANPDVKLWLENNLLKPRAVASGTSVEGVTDDLLAEYSRNAGESPESYAIRLKGYFDEAKANIEKLKNANKSV